jgi:tetratricopeptide (TPR) repeat protein
VQGFFNEAEDFLFLGEEVWIPVRTSLMREGFLRAWSEGARMVRERQGQVEEQLFRLEAAWKEYPPVSVPDIRITEKKPVEDRVLRAFNNLVILIVEREVSPRADRMREAFGPGGGNGRQRNALGVLYARYGVYEKALEEFQAAAERGYERAHINIGNIAFLIGDYEKALSWYKRVEQQYPDNPSVLISLARTYYELDRYEEANRYFQRAREQRPEYADRYNYLSARVTAATGRAAAATERRGDMLWEE